MASSIKITNCWSWLSSNNSEVVNKLWKALRFRARNYFHSRLYKNKVWDGFEEFFKKSNGQFLTGLVPEVQTALAYLNEEYTVHDHREFPEFTTQHIKSDFLQGIELFDYQCDFTNQVIKYKRGIVMAPTGGGKTNILISCVKALKEGTPILILANRTILVEQNYNELLKWNFKNVGRVYGTKHEEPNIITCANVQSLHKIEKLLPHFKALFVDEIHEMMSKSPRKFYNRMSNAAIRVGISATPFKFDGKDKPQKYSVKGYFGPILRTNSELSENGVLTTKKLQEAGTLSQVNAVFYTINEPDLTFQIYQDAVTNGIAANPYFHAKVNDILAKLSGRTLILVDRLEHGDILNKMIPNSLWIQGKDELETKGSVIEQLKTSSNVVVIATQQILSSGVNFYVHNLINAAGGQADHLIIQRIGRGLRNADDKEILNYIDFIFAINEYHGKQ